MSFLAEDSAVSKVLYYVQRFGDLNSQVIGALSKVKSTKTIIDELRLKKKLFVSLSPRHRSLGLKYYIAYAIGNYNISLLNVYNILDEIPVVIARNIMNPKELVMGLVYTTHPSFIRGLEALVSAGVIKYYEVYEETQRLEYPIDYSSFDFKEWKYRNNFLVSEREPFDFPDLSDDFYPDTYDVTILGKKQAHPTYSLKDISQSTRIPFKDVLYHYQNHIVGKGLISVYRTYLFPIDYRISIFFKDDKDLISELSRIPTLLYISKSEEMDYAMIVGQNYMLFDILNYLNSLSEKYTDISIKVHPNNSNYSLTASIPYEHFNGKWNFNPEVMVLRAEESL
ncbi:AsnC family protein [Acidianus brierleyi]|uniref:AsnC family protein n=1 Tax=Acidianus brierleyi TaxID=41673 RepID=A0A2U9IGS3_9CREN|nr:AsnC family protein [Acidianus brierleyi]AWR95241.1 AsnC family protein [Acidianus brierleyi]